MGGTAGHDDSPPPPNGVVPEEDNRHDYYCSTTADSTFSSSSTTAASTSLLLVPLAHAPILLLVYFHKAFRSEVADLLRLVSDALERGHRTRCFVFELLRRFEFLKLACKYHCAAEDEIIFLALDVHVKNVAFTYSLEHKSIDGLFDSIFNRLNAILMEEENENEDEDEQEQDNGSMMKPFQELVFCIGTIQTFISKHMLKEEEQVRTA